MMHEIVWSLWRHWTPEQDISFTHTYTQTNNNGKKNEKELREINEE